MSNMQTPNPILTLLGQIAPNTAGAMQGGGGKGGAVSGQPPAPHQIPSFLGPGGPTGIAQPGQQTPQMPAPSGPGMAVMNPQAWTQQGAGAFAPGASSVGSKGGQAGAADPNAKPDPSSIALKLFSGLFK